MPESSRIHPARAADRSELPLECLAWFDLLQTLYGFDRRDFSLADGSEHQLVQNSASTGRETSAEGIVKPENEPYLIDVVIEREPFWRDVQDEGIRRTPDKLVCAPERRPTALAIAAQASWRERCHARRKRT